MLNILNGGMPMQECTWLSLILSPLDCHIFRHWCGPCGCEAQLAYSCPLFGIFEEFWPAK